MALLQIIFVLILTGTSAALGPEECYNYKELHDASRSWTYQPRVPAGNDTHLQTGWYRMIGPAGNAMKEGYERTTKYGTTPPYFCGSSYPGTLMGSHPTVEEGMIQMTVCFRRRWCFFENDNCDCSHSRTVYVRNCGDYYVYWLNKLGPGYRFCTARYETRKVVKAPTECISYNILRDKSRSWNELSDLKCDSLLDGWYRFTQESGATMQQTCQPNTTFSAKDSSLCGTTYRGWMPEHLPTMEAGRVRRRICFSHQFNCQCIFYASAYVRNCGTFYVYRLQGAPLCNSRYCGSEVDKSVPSLGLRGPIRLSSTKRKIQKEENICSNYVTVEESDRLWINYDPTSSKCDATLYGNFRFISGTKNYQMKEGCGPSSLKYKVRRCGAQHHGWLIGSNPTERQGVVQRIACFSSAEDQCDCTFSTIVKIQNCGGYYVYGITSVPKCSARYCMEENPLLKDVTSKVGVETRKKNTEKQNVDSYRKGGIMTSPDNGGTTLMVMVSSIIALLLILIILVTILMLVLCRQSRGLLSHSTKAPSTTLPPYEVHSRPRMSSYSTSEFSSMKSLDSRRKRDLFRDIDKSFSDLGSRETVDTYQPILKS